MLLSFPIPTVFSASGVFFAGRSATSFSLFGASGSSSISIPSFPFSSMLSRAFNADRRSNFSASSASCSKGLVTSTFAVSSWCSTVSSFVWASMSCFGMDSSAWLIREILPSGSEPTSRLWESCPFRFITNLWLNASKDTAILKPAYSPMTAGALTVFISLHISTRAVPASFLSV